MVHALHLTIVLLLHLVVSVSTIDNFLKMRLIRFWSKMAIIHVPSLIRVTLHSIHLRVIMMSM